MNERLLIVPGAFLLAASLAAGSLAAKVPVDGARRIAEQMTRGKLEADLGNHRLAIEAFDAVSRDEAAPAPMRWEALVRLATVCQKAGQHHQGIDALQRVMAEHGRDPEAVRFLALAVSGVVPGRERWERIWKDVHLAVDRSDETRPRPFLVWPGKPSRNRGGYSGEPISLDLEDAALPDLLRTFSNLTGLEILLDPEVKGTVTMHVSGVPWDEALERVLASQGLMYRLEGKRMRVTRP